MLIGVAGVFLFLALLVVIQTAKKKTLILGSIESVLKPVEGGRDLLGPGARARIPELEALGFRFVGVFKPGLREDPKPGAARPPLRTLSLLAVFLNEERTIEAVASSTSVVYENQRERGSVSHDALSFNSYGPNGEIVKTYNLPAEDFLGAHPANSWRRLPRLRATRALLAAHEEHVRSRSFAVVPQEPDGHERRFSLRHCEELWYLEARGLVRFEGPIVKGTRLLRLRSLLRVLGPGSAEERPLRALALHALIAGLGAAAVPYAFAAAAPPLAAVALLCLLALVALALFRRSVLGSPLYVCIPAAVACHVHGVRGPEAWLAVLLLVIFGTALRQRLRFRAEKARQERLLASISSGAGPSPPAAPPRGAGG